MRGANLLVVDQVAELLGKHPATVRRWIREGKLPAQKLGGKYGIYVLDREEVLQYLVRRLQKSETKQNASHITQASLFG